MTHPWLIPDDGFVDPAPSNFVIDEREEGRGKAVYSTVAFTRGDLVAKFAGTVLPYRTQHTLQLNSELHLLDVHFVGFLAHSCSPNVAVDMQTSEVWALQDIRPGDALEMDYAATEDVLFKQFACGCSSPACRRWISGRKEPANEEGKALLQSTSQFGQMHGRRS